MLRLEVEFSPEILTFLFAHVIIVPMAYLHESPEDHFDREIHKESHRRMRCDERPFSDLSPIEQLTRVAIEGVVEFPDVTAEIRDELTVFEAELDVQGLAEN